MEQVKPVAILMITKNNGNHIGEAIKSIVKFTEYPFKLVILNGGSTDNTDKVLKLYKENFPEMIEVHDVGNIGPMRAINKGLLELTGDMDVYLTHDDVVHPNLYGRDWLTEIVKINKRYKNVGAVTTLNGGGISGPEYLEGLPWLGTWSLFLPRSTIEKVGVLDLAFEPGNGDDIDLTYRIFRARLQVYTTDFWIDHHRMSSHVNDESMGEEMEKIKRRNEKYFRNKHGLKFEK